MIQKCQKSKNISRNLQKQEMFLQLGDRYIMNMNKLYSSLIFIKLEASYVELHIQMRLYLNQSYLFFHYCPLGGDGRSLPSQSFFATSFQSVERTVPPLVWKLFIMAFLFYSSPWANICLKKFILGSSPYSSACCMIWPSISLSILSQFLLTFELDGQKIYCLGAASGIPIPSLLKKSQLRLCYSFYMIISMLFKR